MGYEFYSATYYTVYFLFGVSAWQVSCREGLLHKKPAYVIKTLVTVAVLTVEIKYMLCTMHTYTSIKL